MKNQNSDYRNPHKSIHQLHPDNIAFQRWSRVPEDTRWSHWHCVMQVRRQARSRDDRENPRRSYITILSLLPIQRFKFWRQLSASWVCCMFSFTSPEPDVPVYYPPQIQSPLPIRSSRFIQQMENWAMAGSVRRRMECGIQLSCMQTVSDWEENMAKFPASIQWSQVQGEGRNAACCKYKPRSYLAVECRMPQFLHLYHRGRGHSPCHHQLLWSSEWTRQRTDIII